MSQIPNLPNMLIKRGDGASLPDEMPDPHQPQEMAQEPPRKGGQIDKSTACQPKSIPSHVQIYSRHNASAALP